MIYLLISDIVMFKQTLVGLRRCIFSPVHVVSSQLRFLPGDVLCHQGQFHLFEVGLDIFLNLSQAARPSEGADHLLQERWERCRRRETRKHTTQVNPRGRWTLQHRETALQTSMT